jgi:simple sugar transport system permease protein
MAMSKLKPLARSLLHSRLTFSLVILLIVVVQNIITTPTFFNISITNGLINGYIPDILDEASLLVIVTMGMTLVIAATGGVDISVGAIMAIAASFCGLMLNGSEYRTDVSTAHICSRCLLDFSEVRCAVRSTVFGVGSEVQPMIATLILFTAGRS